MTYKIILVILYIFIIFSYTFTPVYAKDINGNNTITITGFQTLEQQLNNQLINTDPSVPIATLKMLAAKISNFEPECHLLLHYVGQKAYLKYHDFGKAMRYQTSLCLSGYQHGVIEGLAISTKNPQETLFHICDQYKNDSILLANCYHGVGHAFMYMTNDNLPLSLFSCGEFSTKFANSACYGGAFMENFLSDNQTSPSRFLNPQAPMASCILGNKMYSECYQYAPVYYFRGNHTSFNSALEWCDSAPFLFRNSCYFEVGVIIAGSKHNIVEDEKLCAKGGILRDPSCISGVLSYTFNYSKTNALPNQLCSKMNFFNNIICNYSIFRYNHFANS